jgi:predicted transcriptional regulator
MMFSACEWGERGRGGEDASQQYELQLICLYKVQADSEHCMKSKRANQPASESRFDLLGERLKELRNLRRISQVDLARRLTIGQTALSHAETRSDMKLSTLAGYIEALGGRLELSAHFDDLGAQDLLSERAIELPIPPADQLALPGFEAVPSTGRDVVLSIRPQFAEKILAGTKTVELRRRFSGAVPPGAMACIYSTTPTRALTGTATISAVEKMSIPALWKEYKGAAAIPRPEFDSYFQGVDVGYAILLTSPRSFQRPIPLSELRSACDFEPPQSYFYATPQLSKLVHGEWAKAPN